MRVIAGGFLALTLSGRADAADYSKFIIFDGVAAGTKIEGGGLAETWAGPKLADEKVTFRPGTTRLFDRASPPPPTATDNINGATLAQIIKPVPGVAIAFGAGTTPIWVPGPAIADDSGAHNAGNFAKASVAVFTEAAIATKVNQPNGAVAPLVLANAVTATLDVKATAGVPTDGDKYHSADAWAGVFVPNLRTFIKEVGAPGAFTLLGRNQFAYAGTADVSGRKAQRYIDPLMFELYDLTDDTWLIEEVMNETIEALNADFFADDTGIHLGINLTNPESSVSFQFTSAFPSVSDPYTYGAKLDGTGLTVTGDVLPFANWTVTTTPTRIDATYSFGAGGMPYDSVTIAPTLKDGHTYRFGAGGGGGAVALATPDSGTTLLLLLGGLLCPALLRALAVTRSRR